MSNYLMCESLTFEAGDQVILSDIHMNVRQGDFINISGSSGSGKSTLLKVIAGFILPTEGSVRFKGKDILSLDMFQYRKTVNYFTQNPTLFGETVMDNLSFPAKIRSESMDRDQVVQMLERLNLSEEYLNKSVNDLSGGERQRIAFIRNLYDLPEVLLLDEVTSSLDEKNRRALLDWIIELNQEKNVTILMITHTNDSIDIPHRQLVLDKGKVKFQDE